MVVVQKWLLLVTHSVLLLAVVQRMHLVESCATVMLDWHVWVVVVVEEGTKHPLLLVVLNCQHALRHVAILPLCHRLLLICALLPHRPDSDHLNLLQQKLDQHNLCQLQSLDDHWRSRIGVRYSLAACGHHSSHNPHLHGNHAGHDQHHSEEHMDNSLGLWKAVLA